MAQDNNKFSADINDEEFTQGRDGARDIPNAQVGEGIGGDIHAEGTEESFGDVGRRGDVPFDANRRNETEKTTEGE